MNEFFSITFSQMSGLRWGQEKWRQKFDMVRAGGNIFRCRAGQGYIMTPGAGDTKVNLIPTTTFFTLFFVCTEYCKNHAPMSEDVTYYFVFPSYNIKVPI